MDDREKVIKGLEMHATGLCNVLTENGKEYCPYWASNDNCMIELLKDALSLLKAQEPRKKGYWKYPQSLDCCCSECGNQPDHEPGEPVPLYDYCPDCGAEMEVKWQ